MTSAAQRGGRESGTRLNGEGWQPVQGKTGARIPYQVDQDELGLRVEASKNLLRAVRSGNISSVIESLNSGVVDINAADSKGNTGLHIASLSGRDDIARVLIEHGAKVNAQTQRGFTPLYMAAQENHINVVHYLLDHGANPSLATEDGYTPQAVAAKQNHSQIVALLAENESKSKVRLQALHAAAKKDDVNAAVALLRGDGRSNKAHSVNEVTKSGFTPLHIAAHYGSGKVACVLLENGASVNFKARNDVTPLHVASKWGRNNLVGLLIDNNAEMDGKTKDNLTPLHCAARSGHDLVVRILVDRGAAITSKTKSGLTPLHMAVQGDHVECARILLENRADIEDVTTDYLTPLHVGAHCGNVKVAKHLLDSGCVVDSRALNGFTPLHVACKKNRIKVIELLLRYGAAIEATTESGLTPLHVAAFLGHANVITLLLDKGANIEKPTLRGETALHLAARANQTDIMRLLLRNGANVDAKAKEHQTPLHVSSRLGSIEAVQLLLQNNATRDATTKELYTPLHIAVKEGHEEVIQLLLDSGAKQKVKTKKGFTPLHIAAKYGNAKVTKLLLQKNGNPNVEGKNGLAPLHVATHYNNAEVAEVLLENGANVHAVAKNGYTALHIAAKRNHMDIAKIILDHGGKPNVESKNGFTPVHVVAQEGNAEVATLLLDRKGDATAKAKNGLTPMHLAAQEDHVPVAETLVKHGSPIDMQTKAGYTPLHTACHFGQLNMIRFLLDHGANINAATKLGYTPLHQAAQQGHVLVINLLLKQNASPDLLTQNGQTPLSIAHRLGFISVVEVLRIVTKVNVATPEVDDGYNIVYPETMLEAPMDSDEEGGDDVFPSTPKSDRYASGQEMHVLQYEGDNAANRDEILADGRVKTVAAADKYKHIRRPEKSQQLKGQDLFEFESTSGRFSTLSSTGGHDTIHDELRYMHDDTDFRYTTMNPSNVEGRDDFHKYSMDDSDSRQGAITPSSAVCDDLKYHLPDDSQEFSDVWSPVPSEFAKEQYKYRANINGSASHRSQSDDMLDELDEVQTPSTSLHYSQMAAPPTANLSDMDYHLREGIGSEEFTTLSMLNPDSVVLPREPKYSGFLVSFLVDARGGVMNGSRHSGIRLIIPPGRATMPTRVICKLVKKEKLSHPPPLNEGEALATRILQMGSAGIKFSGPVVLEVPHFASIQHKDREITILRSDNGLTWSEHPMIATDESVRQALGKSFPDLESAEKLYQRNVARILTDSFPCYFAIVTRIRQDVKTLGPKGGVIVSSVVPQVQAQFPEGALTKAIKIGLQTHPIDKDLVKKTLVDETVAVSPIVTIEPRHRKFHQPIAITIPMPVTESGAKGRQSAGSPTLRLLCSLVGGVAPSQWEDITGSSPLTLSNDCVSFTTTVSARFWLIDCQNINGCARMANDLYREAVSVPMVAKFAIFGRRRNPAEARLRAFCLTDDKLEKTLEKEQYFKELTRSKDIEVFEGKPLNVDVAGNLEPVLKTDEHLLLNFHAFHENRLHFLVRLKDPKADPSGQVLFVPEGKPLAPGQRLLPACVLTVTLPEIDTEPRPVKRTPDGVTPGLELRHPRLLFPTDESSKLIDRAELHLTNIAEAVQDDWEALADELGVDRKEVEKNTSASDSKSEKALVLLHLWVKQKKNLASGNELERALNRIDREDVVLKSMRNVQPVTDEQEIRTAIMSIEQGMVSVVEPTDETPITSDVFPGLRSQPDHVPEPQVTLESSPETRFQPELTIENQHDVTNDRRPVVSFEDDFLNDDNTKHQFVDESIPDRLAGNTGSPDSFGESFPEREEAESSPERLAENSYERPAESSPERWAEGHRERRIEGSPEREAESFPSRDAETIPDRLVEPNPDQLAESYPDQVVENSPAGVNEEEPASQADYFLDPSASHDDQEVGSLRIYTDTQQGLPELETDIQETEETLDDGTVVKRKTIVTQQKQRIVQRVVMEGPEDELPESKEQAEEVLRQLDVIDPELQGSGSSDKPSTEVEEFEEILPSGEVVKRRIVTTTSHQTTKENVVLENEDEDS